MNASQRILQRQFAADLSAAIALADKRNAEDAQRRAACKANAELCAVLLADAKRRGLRDINWPEYFRNAWM